MNTKEYRILTLIIVVCAAIVIGYSLRSANHSSTTVTLPTVSNAPSDSTIIPLSIVSIRDTASSSPAVNVEYPQFSSLSDTFNSQISSSTLSRLTEFKELVTENMTARSATGGGADIPPNAYSFIASWQAAQINSDYISFIMRYDAYTGGANEDQEIETFNYNVASSSPVTLEDLFPNAPDRLQVISKLARQQLSASLTAAAPGYDPTAMLNEGTAPLASNFAYFTFTDNVVTFYFPKYAVAPGAFGEQKVTILRDQVK